MCMWLEQWENGPELFGEPMPTQHCGRVPVPWLHERGRVLKEEREPGPLTREGCGGGMPEGAERKGHVASAPGDETCG